MVRKQEATRYIIIYLCKSIQNVYKNKLIFFLNAAVLYRHLYGRLKDTAEIRVICWSFFFFLSFSETYLLWPDRGRRRSCSRRDVRSTVITAAARRQNSEDLTRECEPVCRRTLRSSVYYVLSLRAPKKSWVIAALARTQ